MHRLRLSTKARYGTRAVLDIALNEHKGPVTLTDIAERQELSKKYLGQIVTRLLASGILESMRGPQGGYVLAKGAEEITLGQVIRSLEGSMAPVRCVDKPRVCRRTRKCVTRRVWMELMDELESVVDGITIGDLVKKCSGE